MGQLGRSCSQSTRASPGAKSAMATGRAVFAFLFEVRQMYRTRVGFQAASGSLLVGGADGRVPPLPTVCTAHVPIERLTLVL